jgi:hypothetical protein
MDLPASEIEYWKAYYSIFPFPEARAEAQVALLAATISNMSGKSLKRPIDMERFLPKYLKTEPAFVTKSIEEQQKEFQSFKKKLEGMKDAVRNLSTAP